MARNLFLVRHAQPHQDQQYSSDKARELKPEGFLQAAALGKFLKELNHSIDLIIASDSVRTTTTATLIARTIHFPLHEIKLMERIYTGGLPDLLAIINEIPGAVQHLMLVGHNPAISELNNYLTGSLKPTMSTCELNLISMNNRWDELTEGCGEVVSNFQPSY